MIEPHREAIQMGHFDSVRITGLPSFDAHIGLQIEHLLVQNKEALLKAIGIRPGDVVADGAVLAMVESEEDEEPEAV